MNVGRSQREEAALSRSSQAVLWSSLYEGPLGAPSIFRASGDATEVNGAFKGVSGTRKWPSIGLASRPATRECR
jgi:hypothetical protein